MISRRGFLGAAVAGVAVGIVGAAATRSQASLRCIGRGKSILALLDTDVERALFVLGDPNERLLADVAGLTTIGGSRIDLVVATHRILAAEVARANLPLGSAQIVSVQTDASLAPILGSVHLATHAIGLTMGESTRLQIVSGAQSADHPDFLVDIECRERRLLLASNAPALRMASSSGYDALVLPGMGDVGAVKRVQPQVMVSNTRSAEEIGITQIEVFPADPIVMGINENGISVRRNQLSS